MSDTTSGTDRRQSRVPVTIALVLIAAVWIGACVISFMEQIRLAETYEFEMAWLFPLIFDGLASALAVTSWSAALDGRHSPLLRAFTMLAVTGSAWVNAAAVMERTSGGLNLTQVGMAVAAPISAWVAFEFLLGELRRQIMRARGVPAPAPVPALRPVRVLLSPFRSVKEWRGLTLAVTDPRHAVAHGDRSGKPATAPAGTPGTVPASVPTLPDPAGVRTANTQPMTALSPHYTLTVPRPANPPARENIADHNGVSGTDAAAPAALPGDTETGPAPVPARSGTDRHAAAPAANLPDGPAAETAPAANLPDGNGTPAAAESDPAAAPAAAPADVPPAPPFVPDAVPLDPADVLRAKGASIPAAADRAEMDAAALRSAARTAWRTLADAGHVVSGEMLGKAFGRSERWGREQVAAVRESEQGVIHLVKRTERQS